LPKIKAVLTDYIGTLINVHCYTMEASMDKLHHALVDAGFACSREAFLAAYGKAHEKYRLIRYGELREVTNAVWVSETLASLGYPVALNDADMKAALDVFFQDYINSLELRPCAEILLQKILQTHKLGLISNFTYGPVVHTSLKQLGISHYFESVVVSGDMGWRKPHSKIFQQALDQLGVKAGEAVFIGDCPLEDIKGALDAGLKAVFVHSQFYGASDLASSGQKPDCAVQDLAQLCDAYARVIGN
jgi:putative hydrolase of the HAD superfamily